MTRKTEAIKELIFEITHRPSFHRRFPSFYLYVLICTPLLDMYTLAVVFVFNGIHVQNKVHVTRRNNLRLITCYTWKVIY